MVPTDHRNLHQGAGPPRQALQIRRHLHHHPEQRFGAIVGSDRVLGDEEGRADIGAARLADLLLHRDYFRDGCLI